MDDNKYEPFEKSLDLMGLKKRYETFWDLWKFLLCYDKLNFNGWEANHLANKLLDQFHIKRK
jgi:hypothetical protein